MIFILLTALIISFIISVILCILMIPALRALKVGQSIREIGPKWHSGKSGTPTMGGIIFILSSISVFFVIHFMPYWNFSSFSLQLTAVPLCSLAFGLIGFIDDFIKVVLKRNLGLTEKQKFLMQFIVSLVFSVWFITWGDGSTSILLPFTSFKLDLGLLFVPFIIFVMIGTVNSVNLTDGVDGLATSVTIIVTTFFAIVSAHLAENIGVSIFASALTGGLLGFLIFNKHPAKVFMGDTGSLFLGGAVASMAIMLKMPLILPIIGFIYITETLSVILQVISFKLTGRRLFKMSPIHHHFEMVGWSEKKVVAVFSIVTIILCVLAYFSII